MENKSNAVSFDWLKIEYRNVAKVLLGLVALFASAQIIIPIQPVSITLQTVIVSLIALTYSPRLGFITMLSYITAGLMGVPMFSGFGSGMSKILGPSGGYLFGFLLATPLIGIIKESFSKKFLGVTLICLIGHVVIYFFGILWLSTIIGFKSALYSGLIVYIPSGLVKIIIFSYLFSYFNKDIS